MPPDIEHTVPAQVFRQAVEQSALAISITDPKARILYANPAFQRVTGYDSGEIVDNNESILSYKVTPRIVYETMWAQLSRQRAWNGLLVNRRKDGSRYLADLTITPVVDAEGHTSHYLGMHRDVTEVHRLERQVQNQKLLIESVVDAAPVAIVLLDENEKVILDNQEYKKLVGDLGGHLGGEPATRILQSVRARLGIDFEQASKTGRGFTGQEMRIDRGASEARWLSCAGSWFEEIDGSAEAFYEPKRRRYLLLLIQDISALKRQEEAIRAYSLRAVLQERERIASVREALAGAIFQLEGPLNQISAALHMLERRAGGEDAPLTATLDRALSDGRAAIETLRACIPSEAEEAEQNLDVNSLIADVLRIVTPELLAAGIVVDWQPAKDAPHMTGRPRQLATLFRQLLTNAIEAIRETRGEARDIHLATRTRDDSIEVVIADSGPGIPSEWQLKVFEPFFTTKGAEQQHLGMGLTLAQDIVTRHGGVIEVDPDYARGTRLRVQFPRSRHVTPRGEA
jgi:nitrogen fixation negative regulator NifL